MSRPYFHKLSSELASLVDSHKDDPLELLKLVEEIDRRKKAFEKLRPAKARALSYIQKSSCQMAIEKAHSPPLPQDTEHPTRPSSIVPSGVSNSSARNWTEEEPSVSGSPVVNSYGLCEVFSAPLWVRLFGVRSITLTNSPGTRESTITIAGAVAPVPVAPGRWRITAGWFFKGLTIQLDGGLSLKVGLTKSQAERLTAHLYRWQFGEQVATATKQFETMMSSPVYLNRRTLRSWKTTHEVLLSVSAEFPVGDELLNGFSQLAASLDELTRGRNQKFVDEEIGRWKDYFDRVEKNPLTHPQAEAIVSDEDYCLAIAGAGTGKTSTVVGKIGYLIETGICRKDEILALAFARDAANELRERIRDRLQEEVEVRTFHSLGLEILRDLKGVKLKIADTAKRDREFLALIARLLRQVTREEPGRTLLFQFVSKHRLPAKYLEDFSTSGQYFEYLRKTEPYSLKGELVKSFEELLIADWLCLNGIAYEYERPYEVATASITRHQYRPDFYLPEYGIYLEHFGINRQGGTAPGIDAQAYNESIEWKRRLHKLHGTKLVETFSWERMDGNLTNRLAEKLSAHGVMIRPYNPDSVHELMETAGLSEKLVSLLKDFLVVFKENQYSIQELEDSRAGVSSGEFDRVSCFLDLFYLIQTAYTKHLVEREELDFADLISEATRALEAGDVKLGFRRVIVDEYQDISRGRFRFLMAILNSQADARLLSVGDDWQSIYGFTGSDVKKTTEFCQVFDGAISVALDRTFRFNQAIQNLSASFVTTNPGQLRKQISASEPLISNPIVAIDRTALQGVEPLDHALLEIENRRLPRKRWSVFVLGRYKFVEPKSLATVASKYPMLDVVFKTIHSSKGLEADAVVIMDVIGGRYGFPSKVESDPIMGLVIPGEDDFEDAEERRVFYVAMTRARHCVVVVGDRANPSSFWREVSSGLTDAFGKVNTFRCPECGVGELLLKYPRRTKGYAWECSLAPYCSYVAKSCATCLVAPLKQGLCENEKCVSRRKVGH